MNYADQPWVLLSIVGILVIALILDWLWSALLVAIASLPRVQLRRLADDLGDGYQYVANLRDAESPQRVALHLGRQAALLVAIVAAATLAALLDAPWPWLLGPLFVLLFGNFLMEGAVAPALALRHPMGAVRILVHLVPPVAGILRPFAGPIAAYLSKVRARAVLDPEMIEEEHEEQVEAFIEAGEREGLLEEDEGRMMRGIADLDETLVREIMTPRPDIEFIDADMTVDQARCRIAEKGRSRLPAYDGDSDNVIGILHARDLFAIWSESGSQAPLRPVLRPALFLPDSLPLSEALSEMRLKTRIALVVDEYGGLAGLVTLEDLLEEIVGDIRDERDGDVEDFREQLDGSWIVRGAVSARDFEERFEVNLGKRDFDTLAGMIVNHFGRIPRRGESAELCGFRFEVLEADRKRLNTLKMIRIHTAEILEAES
jgi:magnesium and cobalt transporter